MLRIISINIIFDLGIWFVTFQKIITIQKDYKNTGDFKIPFRWGIGIFNNQFKCSL